VLSHHQLRPGGPRFGTQFAFWVRESLEPGQQAGSGACGNLVRVVPQVKGNPTDPRRQPSPGGVGIV
jgi:hypothetical protein